MSQVQKGQIMYPKFSSRGHVPGILIDGNVYIICRDEGTFNTYYYKDHNLHEINYDEQKTFSVFYEHTEDYRNGYYKVSNEEQKAARAGYEESQERFREWKIKSSEETPKRHPIK
jgi:hypothetical protein